MEYPPGKAPFAILLMAIFSGTLLLIFPGETSKGNLHVATFADSHFRAYQAVTPDFERRHPGTRIDLQYIEAKSMTSRLRSAFASDLAVPDIAEIEISSAGTFFLGPLQDIGFVDLTDELNKPRPDGPPWIDRVVRSRFAPYTSRGRIFGIPHDVHPVLLGYRADVFKENGIDPEKLTTWDEFISEGRKLMKKINQKGSIDHYLLELSDSSVDQFEVLLFQNDGGYFNPDGSVRMDDEIAINMMIWYVPLVAGPDRVGNSLGWNWELNAKAAENAYLLAVLMPDWMSGYYQKNVPAGNGKMKLMPLPAFKPGGRRTSTRGGTMMGFTKKSQQFDLAFQLGLEFYYNIESRIQQFKDTNIIPPIRSAWTHPTMLQPNPYWCGQQLGALYASQADATPPQYSSPYVELAKPKMSEALCDAVKYYNEKGKEGFEAFVKKRVKQAADDIRLQMSMNPYQ